VADLTGKSATGASTIQIRGGDQNMAIEYFLKLTGITGEAAASKHSGEIEVLSWSWGASNPTTMTGTGLSAGKVSFADFSISKPTDKASAKLLELCCTGKHIDEGTLTCAKSTGDKNPADFLTIKFNEIAITSIQHGGSSGNDVGSESISFAFGKMEFDYKVQDKDGKLVNAGTAKYDNFLRESA
jgi:type VI secretion system secreted protein Hcp